MIFWRKDSIVELKEKKREIEKLKEQNAALEQEIEEIQEELTLTQEVVDFLLFNKS